MYFEKSCICIEPQLRLNWVSNKMHLRSTNYSLKCGLYILTSFSVLALKSCFFYNPGLSSNLSFLSFPSASSTSPQSAPPPKKEKSPQPKKERTPQPTKEKVSQSKKEKTPQPKKEKTPQNNNKEVSEKAVSSPRKVEANTGTAEVRGVRGSSSLLLVEACCILSGRKVVVEEGTSFLLTSKSVSLTDPAAAVIYLGWGLGKSDAMQALVLSYLLYAR